MNVRELAAQMGENAAAIAEHLLPNGKKHGREWKVGSVDGEAGSSLSVCTAGAKRGVWKDFSTGTAGDMLDLWCACRSVSIADAMREAKRYLGIRDDMPARAAPTYKRPERPKGTKVEAVSPVADWFAARGLNEETLKAFCIAAQSRNGSHYAVFPYLRGERELINVKYRNVVDKKDMRQEGGAEPCLFGWHLVSPKQRSIVIAEGELDAMALYQMGFSALSVNAGAGNHQWIDSDWSRLRGIAGQQCERDYDALIITRASAQIQ